MPTIRTKFSLAVLLVGSLVAWFGGGNTTAQFPPPILRQVLTTNNPTLGAAGQALFRVGVDGVVWSNLNAHIPAVDTNYIRTTNGTGYNLTTYGPLTVNSNVVINSGVSTATTLAINGNASSGLSFAVNTNYLTVTNTGSATRVGIGTATPGRDLHIKGSATASASVTVEIEHPQGHALAILSGGSNVTATIKNGFTFYDLTAPAGPANVMMNDITANSAGFPYTGTNLTLCGSAFFSQAANTLFGLRPTNANTIQQLYIMPNGTPAGLTDRSAIAGFKFFGTDFAADINNYDDFGIFNAPSNLVFNSKHSGTGMGKGFVFRYMDTNDLVTIKTNALCGIGTNSPQATLHVTANNAQNNIIQAGTTNRPSQLTLDTNGVLKVNPGGGLNQLGCYGSLMMNATNIVICAGAASVYTNVAGTGFTTIVTNGFYGDITGNSAALTNLYAGYYRITVCASALGANNQATEWEVFTNEVACDLIGMKKTYDAAARMDDLSMTGILYLPASCRTDFRVQDAGTGGSIAIHRASLTIGTP